MCPPRFDEIREYGYLIPGLIHTKPPIREYAKPRSVNSRVLIFIFVRNSREYVTRCHALDARLIKAIQGCLPRDSENRGHGLPWRLGLLAIPLVPRSIFTIFKICICRLGYNFNSILYGGKCHCQLCLGQNCVFRKCKKDGQTRI